MSGKGALAYAGLSETEVKRIKIDHAAESLKALAITKIYSDLLTGEYNKNLYPKIAAAEGSNADFPPHLLDSVVDNNLILRETSFDKTRQHLLKDHLHDRKKYEDALLNLCISKKHQWVQDIKRDISFKKDRAETRKMVTSVVLQFISDFKVRREDHHWIPHGCFTSLHNWIQAV